MRLSAIACVLLIALMGRVPHAAASPVQTPKKSLAHDGKAHAYWEAENRKRWRKDLRKRNANTMRLGVQTQPK